MPLPAPVPTAQEMTTTSLSVGRLAARGSVRRVDARRYPAIYELTTKGLELARVLDQLHRTPIEAETHRRPPLVRTPLREVGTTPF
jgi:hypothetical protein